MKLIVRKSFVAQLLVGYLVAHPPIYLGVEYLFPGTGAIFQAVNLALVVVSLLLLHDLNLGIPEKVGVVIAVLCVAAISFRAIDQGLLDFDEIQRVGKIALSVAVLVLARTIAHRFDARAEDLTMGFAVGLLLAASSQAAGFALGVTPEDSSYSFGLVGLASSVSLFSAYLASVALPASAMMKSRQMRLVLFALGSLQIMGTLRRTAWLSLLLQTLWQIIESQRAVRKTVGVLAVVAIGTGLLSLTAPAVWEGIEFRLATLLTSHTIGSGRSQFYAIATEQILSCGDWQCAFGIGRAETVALMGGQFGAEIGAHSLILDAGLVFGWPVMVASALFLAALGLRVLKENKELPRLLGGMLYLNLATFALFSGVAFEPVMLPAFAVLGMLNIKRSSRST